LKLKIKVYYRKSLKLSEGKLAAQVGHICKELGRMITNTIPKEDIIIVLGVSDTKFKELALQVENSEYTWYQQVDNGATEVVAGTITAFGYVEEV
jgi:peptidyl-tRNA hydrolase